MLLDLYFHHQNSAPRSGVSRMWLIEYYQQQLALRDKKPDVKGLPLAEKRKVLKTARKVQAVKAEALAAKAESDLEALAQGIADVKAAQQFTMALIAQAKQRPEPEIDFMSAAERYRDKLRRDDEDLLLLAIAS